MRNNFTGRMNRELYYDGGGGGDYSSSEPIETKYVDQRGWFAKLWDKTPIWIKSFIVLFVLILSILSLVFIFLLIHRYVSYGIMGLVAILVVLYSAIYSSIKNSK